MLGFVVGEGKRTVQPGKAQALRCWPDPKCLDDVVSFRAYANYLREFIPRFSELDQHLKNATKKDMTWDVWFAKPESLNAFKEMREALTEETAFHTADYAAAQDKDSGRSFELFVDACDYCG